MSCTHLSCPFISWGAPTLFSLHVFPEGFVPTHCSLWLCKLTQLTTLNYFLPADAALLPPALFLRLRAFVYVQLRQMSLCAVSSLLRSPLFPPFCALHHLTRLLFSHLSFGHKLPPLSHQFKSLLTTLVGLLVRVLLPHFSRWIPPPFCSL